MEKQDPLQQAFRESILEYIYRLTNGEGISEIYNDDLTIQIHYRNYFAEAFIWFSSQQLIDAYEAGLNRHYMRIDMNTWQYGELELKKCSGEEGTYFQIEYKEEIIRQLIASFNQN